MFGRTIGQTGTIEIRDLAAKRSGAFAIAAANYNNDVDFGAPTAPLIRKGGSDAIVAEFSASGSPLQATLTGTAGDEVASAVTYDTSGALIAAETYSFDTTPGIRLTRTSSSATWSRFSQGDVSAEAVATDAESNVILAGSFDSSIDFGGGPLPTAFAHNTFVVKFDRRGDWLWGREFLGTHSTPSGIATDSQGNVIVVGSFGDDIDFGSGVVTGVSSSDLYIAKLSSTGELLFAHTFGGDKHQHIYDVAVLSDDSFVVAGHFGGELDLGTGPINGSGAILVSRFSANGVALWAKPIESTSGDARAYDVAVDPSDNIVLAGSFEGTLQVPTPLQATWIDAFVIGLSPNGHFRWAQPLGGPGPQDALAVATDGKGNVLVGGRFSESIDFGEGPVSANEGVVALFVAKIAP